MPSLSQPFFFQQTLALELGGEVFDCFVLRTGLDIAFIRSQHRPERAVLRLRLGLRLALSEDLQCRLPAQGLGHLVNLRFKGELGVKSAADCFLGFHFLFVVETTEFIW